MIPSWRISNLALVLFPDAFGLLPFDGYCLFIFRFPGLFFSRERRLEYLNPAHEGPNNKNIVMRATTPWPVYSGCISSLGGRGPGSAADLRSQGDKKVHLRALSFPVLLMITRGVRPSSPWATSHISFVCVCPSPSTNLQNKAF